MFVVRTILATLVTGVSLLTPGLAQETYRLTAPELGVESTAVISESMLQIRAADGAVTDYARSRRYDTTDGLWKGYLSQQERQVIRWPATNEGPLQIGRVNSGRLEFTYSQMSVRSTQVAGANRQLAKPVLPPVDGFQRSPEAVTPNQSGNLSRNDWFRSIQQGDVRKGDRMEFVRFASVDRSGTPWYLSSVNGMQVRCISQQPGNQFNGNQVNWWVASTANGFVRIQVYENGSVYALGLNNQGSVQLMQLGSSLDQLWRIRSGANDGFLFESGFKPGYCLTHAGAGQLLVQPIAFSTSQVWMTYAPPTPIAFEPFWRNESYEVRPNPPLPPAQVDLINSHRYALVVLLGDVRRPNATQQIRIEPNSQTTISMDRDAGSTVVETIEIRSPSGVWDSQQLVTAIPPSAYYDFSVYEEHLQSIAIDRTGKSPNQIEDVNYVPKSVGWLPVPAGSELPQRAQINLYRDAVQANNPGAVRRLDPRQFEEKADNNPLESILQELQPPSNVPPPTRQF